MSNELVDLATGVIGDARIEAEREGDLFRVVVTRGDETLVACESTHDFEAALVELWDVLDERHLRLGCNRFRRNAFISGMSRSMSDGLRCYLVEEGDLAQPEQIVDALAPAPANECVSRQENADYLEGWTQRVHDDPAVVARAIARGMRETLKHERVYIRDVLDDFAEEDAYRAKPVIGAAVAELVSAGDARLVWINPSLPIVRGRERRSVEQLGDKLFSRYGKIQLALVRRKRSIS